MRLSVIGRKDFELTEELLESCGLPLYSTNGATSFGMVIVDLSEQIG